MKIGTTKTRVPGCGVSLGFTLIELLVVVLVCGGCSKQESKESLEQRSTQICAGHLKSFVAAKKRWAQDHNSAPTDTPTFDDLAPYFRRGIRLCPDGGTYTIGTVAELPQCSIPAHNDYFKAHPPEEP